MSPSELKEMLVSKIDGVVRLERSEEVGPRVGRELRNKAIQALVIGLILMLLYISVRFNYRFGIGTVLALFHDVLIALGLFTLLNKEVTTAIVAAFLTIVGYSINDSIVVSDRIRENLKKLGGKVPLSRFKQVVNQSINETLSRTVLTASTTLLVLIAILIFGGPVIFDFAFALATGIVVGTYSSIFVVAALVVEARGLTTHSKS
jgi:preprotein translocase SecF subunit